MYYRYNVRVHNYHVVYSGDLRGVLDLMAHSSILLRCDVCVLARINTVHWEDAGYLKYYICYTHAGHSHAKAALQQVCRVIHDTLIVYYVQDTFTVLVRIIVRVNINYCPVNYI